MEKGKQHKTTQGKDAHGNFHPGKGMPSGANKEEGLGILPTDPKDMDKYIDVTDKYTEGADDLADSVRMRHHNRNTSKGEETDLVKKNKDQGDNYDESGDENESPTIPEELPGVVSKELFRELANFKAANTVSLYVPTHSSGVEVNEHFDQIAFKDALNNAEQQLKKKGVDESTIKKLLQPGFDLIREDDFWMNLSEALAVFIADDFFKYIKMPVTTQAEIVTESTFYLTPLLPLMSHNEYFYLLVISQRDAKLFRADAFGMQRVPVNVPKGIEEVKPSSDPDATTFRQGESGMRADPRAVGGEIHGAGGGNADGKKNLAVYFEAVDDVLWEKVFNKENAPLLLAGLEYEIPIYKEACDYHNVWPEVLTGNYENADTHDLYNHAKELMKPFFEGRLKKALENYGNKSATELTSSKIEDVISAAYYGRIGQLFVRKDHHVWGTFNEGTNELKTHAEQKPGSEDLIDNAVVKTLAAGGEVFLLDEKTMPESTIVAALMRY